MNEQQAPQGEDELRLNELLAWAEFCAWSALVMTPIIWSLQGPSVSTDQFVVRTSLIVVSALVGVGLRVRAVVARRRETTGPEARAGSAEEAESGGGGE